MREIKIRTWNGKKMIYGPTDDNPNSALILTLCDTIDSEPLMYTGLKDINGKEIYEGDIYIQGDKNIKYVVVWEDTGLIGKQIGSSSYAGLEYFRKQIKVIGNIYNNPELLKEE
jgi:hypothetical protein